MSAGCAGFRFVPDAADGEAMRTLITAANRVLRSEVGARARRLAGDGDDAFSLDAHGEILWQGGPVGRLTAGETMLAPRVEVRAGDFLEGEARERVRQRLQGFVRGEIERRLAPLFAVAGIAASRAGARHRLPALGGARLLSRPRRSRRRSNRSTGQAAGRWRGWGCGSEPRRSMSSRCSAPTRSASGRCFGRYGTAERRRNCRADADSGKAIAIDPDIPLSFYAAIGRRVVAGLALRPDRLERLAAAARIRSRTGPFAADAELAALGGVAPDALRRVLLALGYRAVIEGDREFFVAKPRRRAPDGRKRGRAAASRNDNPFAKLKELRFA